MHANKNFFIHFFTSLFLIGISAVSALAFTEPEMGDYTHYPIFHVQSQAPNILVVLDNSGSLNYSAYDDIYQSPVEAGTIVNRISNSSGCAEEYASSSKPWTGSNSDLDMGDFSTSGGNPAYTAVRFTGVLVPQGRTINRAYIEFTSYRDLSDPCSLIVYGHDKDDAPYFNTNDTNNLKDRFTSGERTTAHTGWTVPAWTTDQRDNDTRVDVTAIVQEIVDRSGWYRGNDMAFLISGTGKRDAHRNNTSDPAKSPTLYIDYEPDTGDDADFLYYGYFDAGSLENGIYTPSRYSYSSGKFVRDPSGPWDGNWLNWCTMRRVDVLRKVLTGGELAGSSGDDAITNTGEYITGRDYSRTYDDSAGVNTAHHGNYVYKMSAGKMYVKTTGGSTVATYDLKIKKDPSLEPYEFNYDGSKLTGVLQNVGNKARWGNMWYDYSNGGWLDNRVASNNVDTVVADVRSKGCDTWTPLAETYYTAMQYYQQVSSYYGSSRYTVSDTYDPFITDDGTDIPCAKSFVILLTDGASTKDGNIPTSLRNTDSDNYESTRSFADDGTDYLDDVAYYAHINDLRPDMEGDQKLNLYVVYAFDNDPDARALLKDAAVNGGFYDIDGDNKPDSISDPRWGEWADLGHNREWDKNEDGEPDNYFEASDGFKLKDALLKAINDILKRAASGTAVSVLATKGEGEGTMTQAFFKPVLPILEGEIKWLGYMQMLWVDPFGLTREDTDGDFALDITTDKIIEFYLDTASGETRVKRYTPNSGNPYYTDNASSETVLLEEINPLWEAGEKLAARDHDTRTLFTSIGGSPVDFTIANATTLAPYLGVEDDATWSSDAALGTTEDYRVKNIIRFIRGIDDPDDLGVSEYEGSPQIRPRTTDDRVVWKLGDIINSTPVTVSKPVENYGLLYDDLSYWPYYQRYLQRETVVYVGANDGMLHAFTAGVYDEAEKKFEPPSAEYLSEYGAGIVGDLEIGDEMWGYIPKCLLPHLKWLPQTEYTHVPYVDLKVRITDARIFTADDTHPNGWGTVLIGGLNMGGKNIETLNAGSFSPAIFVMDVTNPRDPKLMWEQSFADLGLTTNTPAIIRAGGKWMLAVASGPTDYDFDSVTGELVVTSSQNAHVYIVDLETGGVERDYTVTGTAFSDSYLSSPIAFDKSLNYNVDSIYFGSTFNNNQNGAIFKVTVPQTGTMFNSIAEDDEYNDDPSTWPDISLFSLAPAPITAPFTVSIDVFDNVWVYGGTGRYMDQPDKLSSIQNYFFGIKDPFFNKKHEDNGYLEYAKVFDPIYAVSGENSLFNADPYTVSSDGSVTGGGEGISTFTELLLEARDSEYDGWYRSMCPGAVTDAGACTSSGPSERLLNKPAVLGGIVLLPTFSPNTDVCGFGGNGRLWALYYETGTPYRKRVFGDKNQEIIQDVVYLGSGLSSSFGVHIGREEGGTIFGQMSTGVIQRIDITPAFNPKSQPTYWKDYFEEDYE